MKLPLLGNLIGIRAPEFPEGAGPWFNAVPLTMRRLQEQQRTVLIDFWTYSCVNCFRTLPRLKAWHQKYENFGLTIIGVHTPEFQFEKSPEHVRRFLETQKIFYPVVLDADYRIWNAFGNNVWPHKFLVDSQGLIRYDHAGEGAYHETEEAIQRFLKEAKTGLSLPKLEPEEHHHQSGLCYPSTGELYCGFLRGKTGNPGGYAQDKLYSYQKPDLQNSEDGVNYFSGPWFAAGEYVETMGADAQLSLRFHGMEVNIVGDTANTGRVRVLLNGAPVPKALRGEDIQQDSNATFFEILGPRMYRLIRTNTYQNAGTVTLVPETQGVRFYAWTFGGCAQ